MELQAIDPKSFVAIRRSMGDYFRVYICADAGLQNLRQIGGAHSHIP
jgi:hypothetical protein